MGSSKPIFQKAAGLSLLSLFLLAMGWPEFRKLQRYELEETLTTARRGHYRLSNPLRGNSQAVFRSGDYPSTIVMQKTRPSLSSHNTTAEDLYFDAVRVEDQPSDAPLESQSSPVRFLCSDAFGGAYQLVKSLPDTNFIAASKTVTELGALLGPQTGRRLVDAYASFWSFCAVSEKGRVETMSVRVFHPPPADFSKPSQFTVEIHIGHAGQLRLD